MVQRSLEQAVAKTQWLLSVVALVVFIAGYVIAVITGIWWPDHSGLIATLVLLGLVVGFLNITGREIIPYLVAAIALVVVGNFEAFESLNLAMSGLGDKVNDIVAMLAIFTAPAAVVQAIKAGVVLARPHEEWSAPILTQGGEVNFKRETSLEAVTGEPVKIAPVRFNNYAKSLAREGDSQYYQWRMFVDEPPERLSLIEEVEYLLHPTFPQPRQVRRNPGDGFALETAGWGEFTPLITVKYKDGRQQRVRYQLVLDPGKKPWR
jgi:hypothetical protein